MSDRDKKNDYAELYKDFYGCWNGYLENAKLDLEMHFGAHFTQKQYDQARQTGRTLYPFNKTARQVELIHGYEIRNRHILKIGPIGKEDDDACRQHTGIIMQQMASGGYDILSWAFKWGSLVTGSNLFELYNDREGCRRFARRPYNTFLLDPTFTMPDLSDCRNILCGQWMNEDSLKVLLPADADKIDRIEPMSSSQRWWDTSNLARRRDNRLFEEWWRLETNFEPYVISRLSGDEIPFRRFSKHPSIGSAEAANGIIKNMNMPNGMPLWSKYQKPVKKVKLTVYVDGEMVWDGDNPTGLDEYNFIWVGGEWAPECDRDELKLRSFTRKLRMPQHARDKRLNQAIDIIESQINSGQIGREGSFVDDDDVYQTGQGKTVWVKNDAPALGSLLEHFQKIPAADLPAGVFQLLEVLDREETTAGGLNEEIFGSDDNKRDVPGVLAKFRTGQALTGQQGIFQGFRRAKWQCGIKMVKLNQRNLNPQRVSRFVNELPAQGFYVPDFAKFDCMPIEGLLTDSQRQLYHLELRELYTMFPNIIPASLVIESAPIQQPKEVLEKIKQQEQMQTQMLQAQLKTKQVMENMMQAQAMLDMARAKSELVDAGYDRARTLTEIQKLQAEPRLGLMDRYLELLKLMNANFNQRQLPAGQ